MDTKKKEEGSLKKNAVTHITIIVVIVGLIVIAVQLANSNFDFANFLIKLHGG